MATTSRTRAALLSPFFWAAIAGLILIPVMRPLTRHVPDPPPVSGQLPAFELLDHRGNVFASTALKDRVYLVNFISARCDAACDARLLELVKLQRRCQRMGVKLWLVTFATDPEHDTPAQLRALVERHGGDLASSDNRWILLTGRAPAATRLLETSLFPAARSAMGAARPDLEAKAGTSASAPAWSVLVDGDGGVRGAYPAHSDGLFEVYHRAQHVMSLRPAWR